MRSRTVTVFCLIVAGCVAFVAGRVWRSMPAEPASDNAWATAAFTAMKAAGASRDKGATAAIQDIKVGKLKLKEYPPLPTPAGFGEYVSLLRARCGVDYEVAKLPADVSDVEFNQEVRGWNDKMTAEIERKFGTGILSRLDREARQRWQKQVNVKGSK